MNCANFADYAPVGVFGFFFKVLTIYIYFFVSVVQ